ncbi:AAA family ATPase [Streptomyces sp. VRA16 Mangrove soil]|uniref:nSTAND1 domain-containing NTPase n=1 Tax=Streptomyces sp. VRA16 Mangrove soil TaxID=2817434 RepID=UPI001A9F826C|nr:AAA family ATPase [Streptomyces sp. VRA16 Mangrove soil]MBO1332681.1 AAA family ATPase [Streptomyces sp. VRA16 Mangrove soil]
MDRRAFKLVADVLLMLVGSLLGIATNYATGQADHVPLPLRLLRDWSVPLIGVALVLLVAVQTASHFLDRPAPIRRAWDREQPPYPGLEAFTEDDAAVFFGRDRDIVDLVRRLHPAVPGRAQRFVTVVGPSGSGKSSLVRAGLLPTLARRRGRWTVAAPFTPGADPVGSLRRCRPQPGGVRPALIVIDQLEELLTRCGREEREEFLTAVREALHRDPRLWVVATLRSDFLTGFLESGFADLVREPTLIGSLDRNALHEVIEKPAEQAGLTFAPGLVARMVDECGGGDALPLLAYTLQELYRRAGGSGGSVSEEAYRALGGVAGALAEQADRIRAELGDLPVMETLLRFVTVDGGEAARRRVLRADLNAQELEIADAFVAGRLLTSDEGVLDVAHEALFRQWAPLRRAVAAHTEELRRRTELERWGQDWDRSGRQDGYLLTGERLSLARRWMTRSAPALGTTPLLEEFVDRSLRADRSTRERAADAVAVRVLQRLDREPEAAVLAALAAVEECAATPGAVQALHTAQSAARLRAVLRGFDAGASGVAWSPDGLQLAVSSDDGTVRVWEPGRDAGPVVLAGDGAWMQGVAWSPDGRALAAACRDRTVRVWSTDTWTESAVLRHAPTTGEREEGVGGVAWSPDGRHLASVGSDSTVRIWDAGTYTASTVLRGHRRMVWSVTWSPDGAQVASGGEDGSVRVWDVLSGAAVTAIAGRGSIESVRWSPDGQQLASADGDRSVRVWDTRTWEAVRVLDSDVINSLAWSPDGTRLAGGDADRSAYVWNLIGDRSAPAGAEVEIRLTGHADTLYGIAWSPDGTQVATASRDRTAAVWDVSRPVSVLADHDDAVLRVAWSPDGTRIAATTQDGSVRIRDVTTGRTERSWPADGATDMAWSPDGERLVIALREGAALVRRTDGSSERLELDGHIEELSHVTWSDDGTRIATGSRDGTARIWNAATGAPLHILRGHQDWVAGTAWSPDGRYLATSSTDRTAIVWDSADGTAVATLHGHLDYVWKVDWSPDGRRLATCSRDRTVRLWNPVDGTELAVLNGHEDRVLNLAWSPDGTRLASVSRDHTVRLWNPDTATQTAVLGVHADWVNGLTWHPDGTRLATASHDRTVRLWTLADHDVDGLLRRARNGVFRELTAQERRAFLLPDIP